MILNSFNAAVTGASATALIAIGDVFGDAERLAGMNTQKLLAVAVILSWLIVIYQNRKVERDRLAERLAHEKTLTDFMAHHNASINLYLNNSGSTSPDGGSFLYSNCWFEDLACTIAHNAIPTGSDGTHLLASGNKQVIIGNLTAKLASDSTFSAVVSALETECKRLAGKTTDIKSVLVASTPTKTSASISFTDGTHYNIPDCFALAGTDSTFAGVFNTTMGEIARQAKLTIG